MQYLRVPNLSNYQHYTNRTPPWIKLHRSALDSYSLSLLSDELRGHLVFIWLLASQVDNRIPNDSAWVTKKIGAKKAVDLESLIKAGHLEFTELASMPIAPVASVGGVPHGGTEESRGETEKRREEAGVKEDVWKSFLQMRVSKKKPATEKAKNLILNDLIKWKEKGYDPNAILENSIRNSWTDVYEPKTSNNRGSGQQGARKSEGSFEDERRKVMGE